MDFEFSAEQEMLRASVRAFLADRSPISAVRAAYDAPAADRAVWDGLVGLGVVGLLAGDEHTGTSTSTSTSPGMVDAAVVLEELGRAVCPAPYASSAIGAVALADDALLPRLAAGAVIGTVAVFEAGTRFSWCTPATRAARDGDGYRLDGVKVHVPDAGAADVVLVTALDDDGALGVFATDDFTAEPVPTVDGSRKQGRVALDAARARRVDLGGRSTRDAITSALDRLGVALAVDGVGAAQRALELAVDYAKERVQFDRPIGSFQAVQHLCADMLRTVELARAAAYYACWALDAADPAEAHRAATMARAFAADALPSLGATAIQVFGGIGFTWEHDIHLYFKRLLTAGQALGTASDHLETLAGIAVD